MKAWKWLVCLAAVSLTACGTFRVGVVNTPTAPVFPTTAPTQPVPAATTGLPTQAAATAQPPTQAPAAPLETPRQPPQATEPPELPLATAGPRTVKIFLIAIDDNGQSGDLVGCGDSAVPVEVQIAPTQAVLRGALEALLAIKDPYYGQSGLYDALYQSDLKVEDVNIKDGTAIVNLTGSMMLGGECDNPRVQAQLEQTALQFATVQAVQITVNGKALKDVLSLK